MFVMNVDSWTTPSYASSLFNIKPLLVWCASVFPLEVQLVFENPQMEIFVLNFLFHVQLCSAQCAPTFQ